MADQRTPERTEARTEAHTDAASAPATEPARQGQITVVTRTTFAASAAQVWHGLMFFEDLGARPALHLRLLLPTPIRTERLLSQVGDETRCVYEGGHLIKRLTRIERGRFYEFEVVEQALQVGGSIRLCGGRYHLIALADDRTEIEVETRYRSEAWPRWLWRPIERAVCHAFHRHLLTAMRRKLALQRAAKPEAA